MSLSSVDGITVEGNLRQADLLREGFRRRGLRPDQCVLVGDTNTDVRGAKEAGCDCIKVNWGFGFTSEEKGSISRPEEILDLV